METVPKIRVLCSKPSAGGRLSRRALFFLRSLFTLRIPQTTRILPWKEVNLEFIGTPTVSYRDRKGSRKGTKEVLNALKPRTEDSISSSQIFASFFRVEFRSNIFLLERVSIIWRKGTTDYQRLKGLAWKRKKSRKVSFLSNTHLRPPSFLPSHLSPPLLSPTLATSLSLFPP